jgi:molybdopterin-containing oxidoreductase family iron-sulfur binding subunit
MPDLLRALDESGENAEFMAAMQNEFPEGAAEWADPVSRRRFLGLMGASLSLAGAAGCNLRPAPQRKILPYTTQPDEITPGVPIFFATAAPLAGYGTGVLVRSHEGRPVKIEGNPDHPSSRGGVGIFEQATVLDLYDPDRSAGVTHYGNPSSYEQAIGEIRKALYEANGQPRAATKLRILTETVTSPTLGEAITKLLHDFPQAKWVQFDAVSRDNAREGIRRAFGKPLNISYDFTKADVVLTFEDDFLCSGPGSLRYSRDFAARRKVRQDKHDGVTPDKMNRLYAVECMPTNTGAVADHRLSLTSTQIDTFVRLLAQELGVSAPELGAAGTLDAPTMEWLRGVAADLKKPERKGKTAILAGNHLSPTLHALVLAINSQLGNLGQTILQSDPIEIRPDGKVSDLKTLTEDMMKKDVEVLFIFCANPAYTAPVDVPFARALENVPFKLHMGPYQDETAALCDWHMPEAHYLEAWGDICGHDGTITIQQPLIAPLHRGKSIIEFLADVSSGPAREGLDIVRAYWRGRFGATKPAAEFEIFWQESVRLGVVTGSTPKPNSVPLANTWAGGSTPAPTVAAGQYELNFRADPTLYDGRFANNGWLQELPKPLIKNTWDNAVFMSQATADKLGVLKDFRWTGGEHGRAEVTVVELDYKGHKVKGPAWIMPGHANDAITIHLGHGRPRGGRVANITHEPNAAGEAVRGFNAYALRTNETPWVAPGATLTKTGDNYFLANTQGRWSMLEKDKISGKYMDRAPVRRGTLHDYEVNPEFAKIPPMAAGETQQINENVPGPVEDHSHDHGHGHSHGNEPVKDGHKDSHDEHQPGLHDSRLMTLTMYKPVETLAPNVPAGQRRRWAMAIDLSACTGCSACVIACVSENNTPVVGKYEVTRGRLMHWINIDRYYGGPQESPNANETYFQPRMCVQCENAPCEIVCPVGATVHSTDGLNDMVYNRCVGTRYCSNNCPYKVRRFNFLTYADWATDTLKLGRNPDVSVRSRGVMEKCTFCVQRIRGAEIVAEREQRPIKDGEILTACQAACPSNAIIFGDLNDGSSVLARWKKEPTNYGLLAELNTRPRLTHLAALRNPNPAMPKGA